MSHVDTAGSTASILQGFRSLLRGLAIFNAAVGHGSDAPHSSFEVRLDRLLKLKVRAVEVVHFWYRVGIYFCDLKKVHVQFFIQGEARGVGRGAADARRRVWLSSSSLLLLLLLL